MSYIAISENVAELGKFSFSFDEEDNLNELDVKKGPDRFRMGYQEVCLKGHNARSMWDLAESLEDKGYRLVDAEETGLTYYSPDGRTEIYLDEELNAGNEMSRIMILRGELTEDKLPNTEDELKNLFYEL
jgi:hypothetical protein